MIERHIDKNGTKNFQNSSLVVTEINNRYKTPIKSKKGPMAPVYDINRSSKVLMERKKVETMKMFG